MKKLFLILIVSVCLGATKKPVDELTKLTDTIDNAILRTENLLNQYEPGSVEYNKFSRCLANLRGTLDELTKPSDCPRLSVTEQGQFIEQYLNDNNQWKQFREALKTYGYCPKQFGLK